MIARVSYRSHRHRIPPRDTFPRPPRAALFPTSLLGVRSSLAAARVCFARPTDGGDDAGRGGAVVTPPRNARSNTHAPTHARGTRYDAAQRDATHARNFRRNADGERRATNRGIALTGSRDPPKVRSPRESVTSEKNRITAIRSRSMRPCPMRETPCCCDQLNRSASRDWPRFFRRVLQAAAEAGLRSLDNSAETPTKFCEKERNIYSYERMLRISYVKNTYFLL